MLMRRHSNGVDEFVDDLRGADVTVVLANRPQSSWRAERYPGADILLQFGFEGGERILHGRSWKGFVGFATRASEQIFDERMNGRPVGPWDFAIVPPSRNFVFSCGGAHDWIAVSLVAESLLRPQHPLYDERELLLSGSPSIVTAPQSLCRHYREIALATRTELLRSSGVQDVDLPADLARPLIEALAAAIKSGERSDDARSGAQRAEEQVVHQALRYATSDEWHSPSVEQIAAAVGVSERTLLRAYHNILGMGTAHYMKLWKLNAVRRSILTAPDRFETITALLLAHGVTEFGRFAGEYRNLFGERPSATLAMRRSRPVQTSGSLSSLMPTPSAGATPDG